MFDLWIEKLKENKDNEVMQAMLACKPEAIEEFIQTCYVHFPLWWVENFEKDYKQKRKELKEATNKPKANKILILEDNNYKIIEIMDRSDKVFENAEIFVVRENYQAKNIISNNNDKWILFVDYDLNKSETGMDFLQWLLPNYRQLISDIYIISASPSNSVEMSKFCWLHGIATKAGYK